MFDEYRQVLGAEKIRTILVQRGHQVSAEYISQLMREMGLSSVRSTAKKEYLKLRETERKKNILQQQFTADQPNQRWVSDVTCFKLRDHYSHKIVGWVLADTLRVSATINALQQAIEQAVEMKGSEIL